VAWAVEPKYCEECAIADGGRGDFTFGIHDPDDEYLSDHHSWKCNVCGEYSCGEYILIDGHNRYDICTKNNIGYEVCFKEFENKNAAVLWVIDNQFGRRNLAALDRIALARKREEILRPLAKENLKTPTGGRGLTSAKLPESKPAVDTRKESAKTAHVGERTYDAGKLILDAAEKGEISQEVVESVRREETSIHRVAKDIKEKRQSDKRKEARKEAASKTEPQFFDNVHIGDFRVNASKVADGSLSLIFTDPPYDKKAEDLFEGLAEFASSKLAEGGSLIMYLGHLQLLAALKAFDGKLRHWWTCACFHDGGKTLMREYGIRVGWKPMLWFVKGTRDDKQSIVVDVISGATEKSHHDWQQDQSEAEYWISNLCHEDGVVCDPFLGGGTTAAAAIKLKRKWVGFEIDHDQAVIAMARCRND
jgi:16S rRNA G966 N2-methylase RsmD